PQQCACTRRVGNPPVGLVAGVTVLDEIHTRKTLIEKDVAFVERVVVSEFPDVPATAFHRLEEQPLFDELRNSFQRVEWMTQVIEHAHENDEVEPLALNDFVDVIDVA